MGQQYTQLSLMERIELYRLRQAGFSLQAVADRLGRCKSTISRELSRNSKSTKQREAGYSPVQAQSRSERRRRWDARFKLARDPQLRAYVRVRLQQGWSPEQIAGVLKAEKGRCVISHEAIYRFIYHRSAQKDYWHRLLPRHKSRRGRLGKRGGSPATLITQRVPIHQRPATVDQRDTPGHWEGDLMLFARYGQAILVTHERYSRLLLASRQPNKAADPVVRELGRQFKALPEALRQSLTVDNGTEFAYHYRLKPLGVATYFCDPHAPWQKGGIENAIGRMRRPLPRKTDLATLSKRELNHHIAHYNNTPRKCLGFQTPAAVFLKHLNSLHFKRESTFPPARE